MFTAGVAQGPVLFALRPVQRTAVLQTGEQ